MREEPGVTPDLTPAESDPGDETARRYHFQWTYAAITCCMLLDDTEDVAEVFCEHHEDVLLKHSDGTFSGLQVKTRAADQVPWKTRDNGVRTSFGRFALLEAQFPSQFRAFRFLTNHPLHSAGNGQDPAYVLRQIKAASDPVSIAGPTKRVLQSISRQAGCSEDAAFAALKKTLARHDLPGLTDVFSRLLETLITVWPEAVDCSYGSIRRAALALVGECRRASALAHADVLPAYLPAGSDPDNAELAARLRGKRIDKTRLLRMLDRGLDETVPLLCDPADLVEPGAGTTSLLHQKLNAGGFSAVSLNSAEDLRNKADYLGIAWTKKHGKPLGLQRYSHMQSLVLRDSADAFEATRSSATPFGVEMLSDLRARFNRRRAEDAQLHGCSNEHLEGFAYSLTSQCKVQWSLDRPWENE